MTLLRYVGIALAAMAWGLLLRDAALAPGDALRFEPTTIGALLHAIAPRALAADYVPGLEFPAWILIAIISTVLLLSTRRERRPEAGTLSSRLGGALLVAGGLAGANDAFGLWAPASTSIGDALAGSFSQLAAPDPAAMAAGLPEPIAIAVAAIVRIPFWVAVLALGTLLRFAAPTGPRCPNIALPEPSVGSESRHKISEPAAALLTCTRAFMSAGVFSGVINVLMLTGAIYMLEVYDRVLPSKSVPTLVALSFLALFLFAMQGFLDILRGRLLTRVGNTVEAELAPRTFYVSIRLPLRGGARAEHMDPLKDLDTVRSFLSGQGPSALFDLPWFPIYLIVIFALHPLLGWIAAGGALALVALTMVTEFATRAPIEASVECARERSRVADSARRNAETIAALGMARPLARRWKDANCAYSNRQLGVSDTVGGLSSASRTLRFILQSAMLGAGAYLVIFNQASPGMIIAGSILSARALAPIDLAIGHWRGFVAARQSWARLTAILEAVPQEQPRTRLPAPCEHLVVDRASACPPGNKRIVLVDIMLKLRAGQALGIVGPSGSGKSSLARLLVGVWRPSAGRVLLDGASIDQWSHEDLGRSIGYLPQEIELFSGTIALNIARLDPGAPSEMVIAAARAAGAHDMILALPSGYDTDVGERGRNLSAGQRQRVALARALFGDPFLVVLDEPNANLDSEGDAALAKAIIGLRERRAITVIVSHRNAALTSVDLLLSIRAGKMSAFGPRNEVLADLRQRRADLQVVAAGQRGR